MSKKKILLTIVLLIAAMQVVVIKKSVPETGPELEYIQAERVPADIAGLIKASCYDCHSYKTNYPWYSNIAPVSWILNNHIREGREHLNFSLWGEFSTKNQQAIKRECMEVLGNNEMPLKSYRFMHAEARLSEKQKELLIDWFNLQVEHFGHRPSELLSQP